MDNIWIEVPEIMGLTFEPNSAQVQTPNTLQLTEESQNHES